MLERRRSGLAQGRLINEVAGSVNRCYFATIGCRKYRRTRHTVLAARGSELSHQQTLDWANRPQEAVVEGVKLGSYQKDWSSCRQSQVLTPVSVCLLLE